jgi:Ran GTPase-activating protein (RanGAP) involved in mRNA processing and transport
MQSNKQDLNLDIGQVIKQVIKQVLGQVLEQVIEQVFDLEQSQLHSQSRELEQMQTQNTHTIATQTQLQTQTQIKTQTQTHLLLEVLIALNDDLEKFWPANSTIKFLRISKYVNNTLKDNNIFLPMKIVISNFDNKTYNMCTNNLISKIKLKTKTTQFDLIKIIHKCKKLKKLDIRGCRIEQINKGFMLAINILNTITNSTNSLTCINLSNITSPENMNNEVAFLICSIIFRCHQLKKISISRNKLNDRETSMICKELIKVKLEKNLEILDLSENHIGSYGFIDLSEFFKKCTELQYLNLSGNNLQNGALSCVTKALSCATKLQSLNLSNTKLNSDSAIHFSKVIKSKIFRSLLILDLSNNNISDLGVIKIAFVLRNFIKLKSLNLSENNISMNGVTHLLKQLQNCKNMKIINWDDSNYNNITLNFETSYNYRNCITTLTSLDLSYNRINLYKIMKNYKQYKN